MERNEHQARNNRSEMEATDKREHSGAAPERAELSGLQTINVHDLLDLARESVELALKTL